MVIDIAKTPWAHLSSYEIWREEPIGSWAAVEDFPRADLIGCMMKTEVRLANGHFVPAILDRIWVNNAALTKFSASILIQKDGQWFGFRRAASLSDARALSDFLGLRQEDVFPIAYDVSRYASGDPEALRGYIVADYPDDYDFRERAAMLLAELKRGRSAPSGTIVAGAQQPCERTRQEAVAPSRLNQ